MPPIVMSPSEQRESDARRSDLMASIRKGRTLKKADIAKSKRHATVAGIELTMNIAAYAAKHAQKRRGAIEAIDSDDDWE